MMWPKFIKILVENTKRFSFVLFFLIFEKSGSTHTRKHYNSKIFQPTSRQLNIYILSVLMQLISLCCFFKSCLFLSRSEKKTTLFNKNPKIYSKQMQNWKKSFEDTRFILILLYLFNKQVFFIFSSAINTILKLTEFMFCFYI